MKPLNSTDSSVSQPCFRCPWAKVLPPAPRCDEGNRITRDVAMATSLPTAILMCDSLLKCAVTFERTLLDSWHWTLESGLTSYHHSSGPRWLP